MTTDSFLDTVSSAVRQDGGDLAFLDREFVENWLAGIRMEIADVAADNDCAASDYACTFLGAVLGTRSACYIQIGDGAMIVTDGDGASPKCIFWPQHGEFANSTFFVTQDQAHEVLMFARSDPTDRDARVQQIAIFSDGLERLILDFRAKAVHAPALRPIFEWLAHTEPSDAAGPSEALQAYLGSAHVNQRTDDDKTLVMATRASPLPNIAEGRDR